MANVLDIIYRELSNNLLRANKYKNKSALISLVKLKSNSRYKLLYDSALEKMLIEPSVFFELKEKGHIEMTDRIDFYTFTVKGLWEYEKKLGIISDDLLIKFMEEKYFNLFGENKYLLEKEKVVVLSLIAGRAFSIDTAADLKKDEYCLESWTRIVEKNFDFLLKNKIISNLDKNDMLTSKGNELPISNLLRHTDSLPKKTNGLWTTVHPQKYYLNIVEEKQYFNKMSLSYIFKIIFEDKIGDIYHGLIDHLDDVAYSEGVFINNVDTSFVKPEYDVKIKEALDLAIGR